MTSVLVFTAFLWAGIQNALAGGGSFVTLPVLMLMGLDPRAANVTSTLALFPAQTAAGWTGRNLVSDAREVGFRSLVGLSLVGGALGAGLLLVTPQTLFERVIPWLVLFATAVFAWGSFGRRAKSAGRMSPTAICSLQFLIAVYGGYFGGAISFLMFAVLTSAGVAMRAAGATKNVLAAAMNASAVAVFAFSPQVRWSVVPVGCAGAIIGGVIGGLALRRISERWLRIFVVGLGLALTVVLFVRA